MARECLEFAEQMNAPAALDIFWPAMITPFREQNRLSEIEPLATKNLRHETASPVIRALLALVRLELGETAIARAEFEAMAADGFNDIPHDGGFLACLASLAELCGVVGDQNSAHQLLKILEPYANLNVLFGPLAGFGAVARYLASLAVAAGRTADAERYFERSLSMNSQMDARTYVAYTKAEYATMLLERGSPSDRTAASKLLSGLSEYAEVSGMHVLAPRAKALLEKVEKNIRSRESEFGLGPRPAQISFSQLNTDSFAIEVSPSRSDAERANGRRGFKGLSFLAYLLAHPNHDVHSLTLSLIVEGQPVEAGSAIGAINLLSKGLGDAGPMLDARAKREYQHRLGELRGELDEAREANDFDRAAAAEEEIDFIEAEVSRAVGLGGRDRLASSATERARISVTKAIKAAVAKISQQNRDLADYLLATIKTGNFCSYRPDDEPPVFWKSA